MYTNTVRLAVIVSTGLTLAYAALDARATRPQLTSHWRDQDIVIDGSDGEWRGPLQQIDEKQLVALGAENDGQSLYLVLTTSDPVARMQIMRQGLIVWFDPDGKDRKIFGLQYPVGNEPEIDGTSGGGGPSTGSGQGGTGGGGWGRPRGGSAGGGRQRPRPDAPPGGESIDPPNRLVLLGPKKDDARSLVADKVPGFELKIAHVEGALIYEMKLPLQKTPEFEYAIGARPGSTISVGLETLKPKGASHFGLPGGMGGGMGGRGGGGRGGGGMGGGGGRGGGMGGQAAEPSKPIKGWATLQLAREKG
jgi:hypothetical protein